MMEKTIAYLQNKGFKITEKIESLKTKQSNREDLRYFWDGNNFGLHISNTDFNNDEWFLLKNKLKEAKAIVRVLYLGSNKLQSFELSKEDFPMLEFLNLSENQELNIVKINNQESLRELRITKCKKLSAITLKGDFNSLQILECDSCNLQSLTLPNRLPQIKLIKFDKNNISNPDFLYFLTNVTYEPIIHWQGNPLPELVVNILKEGRYNDLKGLLDELQRGTAYEKLRVLEPYVINVYDLDFEMIDSKLTFLDLGNQNLRDIPTELAQFEDLETLVLGNFYVRYENNVSSKGNKGYNDFSRAKNWYVLTQLPNLKDISFNSCKLRDLKFISNFKALQTLDLTANPDIKDNLNSLKSIAKTLKTLYLSNNELDETHLEIFTPSTFKNLEVLSLTYNNITTISPIQHLVKNPNVTIFLQRNKIGDFQEFEEVVLESPLRVQLNLNQTKGVFISENPIDEAIIPYFDITDENLRKERFQNYFDLLASTTTRVVKRLRLILLGNTSVGKTTFHDFLKNADKAKEGSTHGINLFSYETPNQTLVQGYDFGGQDYYHNNHSPYFSPNAHYFLIWGNGQKDDFDRNEKGEDLFPLRYWLGSLKCIIENKNTSGVNVDLVQNTRNNSPIEELNVKDLKAYYKNHNININAIRESSILDCKTKQDSSEREKLDELFDKYAKDIGINELTEKFNQELKDSNLTIIHINKLNQFKNYKSTTPKLRETLLNLSHNSFGCYYVPEVISGNSTQLSNDLSKLKDFVIVDLEKFNRLIYSILLREEDGYFTKQEAAERIEEYKKKNKIDILNENDRAEELEFILVFMLYHKIIFEIKNGESNLFLSPMFLKNTFTETEKLLLDTFEKSIIQYEFNEYFHNNVFTEIIIGFIDYLILERKEIIVDKKKQRETQWRYVMWKNRIILYETGEKQTKKLLYLEFDWEKESDRYRPILKISLNQKKRISETFFERIIEKLDELLIRYHPTKLVSDKYGNFIPFKILNDETRNSKGEQSDFVYYNNKILRKGDFKIFLKNTKYKMKKVFISYSKFDEQYKEEFKEHLINLRREGLVDTFDDRQLELGEKWDQALKQKIDECDYFVCLVSVKFLNVRYIYEEEIPRALENSKRIIPIIIKPCDWTNTPIRQFQNNDDPDENNTKLGDFNAHNKGVLIGLNPEFINKNGKMEIREYSEIERDYMWLKVVDKLRDFITKDN